LTPSAAKKTIPAKLETSNNSSRTRSKSQFLNSFPLRISFMLYDLSKYAASYSPNNIRNSFRCFIF